MLSLRVVYADVSELRRAIDQEITRGVLLVRGAPTEGVLFREPVSLSVAAPGGSVVVEAEVVSVLPGVGVAVSFPADRVPEVKALCDAPPVAMGATPSELGSAPVPLVGEEPPAARAMTMAEKIQIALHGTREDRAAILRDQNRSLYAFVLKSPQVTVDEVTGWAKNAQMSADFLKQIGDRKEWLSRPGVALALVRNPRTPADLALRALDHVPVEALRQMAKGMGVPPHVVQAARKKVISK
jgi:hypothetical protein